VKTLLSILSVILLLALLFFRLHSESGLMELENCRTAVTKAKSWTIETTTQPESPNLVTLTTRNKVSCPDDYADLYRTRTPDDVMTEQSTVHANGVTYVENADGKWEKSETAGDPQIPKQCGKGPSIVQSTVVNAIFELPRRRAASLIKGKLQTVGGLQCQDWSVDYGNEWPQFPSYTVCIDTRTHLPRRITFAYPSTTHEFSGWNSTTVQPPAL
jgi:hypothetical protein